MLAWDRSPPVDPVSSCLPRYLQMGRGGRVFQSILVPSPACVCPACPLSRHFIFCIRVIPILSTDRMKSSRNQFNDSLTPSFSRKYRLSIRDLNAFRWLHRFQFRRNLPNSSQMGRRHRSALGQICQKYIRKRSDCP